ncbi:hypothetical protein SPFM15_00280 [Salmonella phage SPFM15]|nr:hypothetical protein SPFM5_00275 [Salmonella phage SPFM5]VFR13904.1 hypothetical protein SPFM15_00280 [Salmonella phage SPFM15]
MIYKVIANHLIEDGAKKTKVSLLMNEIGNALRFYEILSVIERVWGMAGLTPTEKVLPLNCYSMSSGIKDDVLTFIPPDPALILEQLRGMWGSYAELTVRSIVNGLGKGKNLRAEIADTSEIEPAVAYLFLALRMKLYMTIGEVFKYESLLAAVSGSISNVCR